MNIANAQPDPCGSLSKENAPQVVVRAGKYYVCSACGTMVELPEEVVGQLVLAATPTKEPAVAELQATCVSNDKVDRYTSSASIPSQEKPASRNSVPPRPRRPRSPKRESFVGTTIDGLRVPSAQQLDRALAWVSFHLRVLDRQGSEIKRLKKRLKQQPTTGVLCPHEHAKTDCALESHAPAEQQHPGHAHEDVSMAPEMRDKTERGPPG